MSAYNGKGKLGVNRNSLVFTVLSGLFAILIILMNSPVTRGNEAMSLAISIDLLLVVPLIYFALIRKTQIPKTTIVPIMVLGMILGMYFLPKQDQTYLLLFKTWALPILELSIVSIIIFKFWVRNCY